MKKMLLALAAVAAFTGSAFAADLPARMPVKAAPLPVPVANWTGCYVGGGGGYGMWNQENTLFDDVRNAPVRTQLTGTTTAGGRGYFGTVQGGCDYQFGIGAQQFVIGAFGDYDFADLHGNHQPPGINSFANEKLSSQWAVGGRIGWLVVPQLLTYFSAGYTEARFDRQDFYALPLPNTLAGIYQTDRTYKGWFLGAGDEYAINFLPGLFWKTEYRVAQFDRQTNPFYVTGTTIPTGLSEDSKKWVQTVRSELVYRFNWGGPVVAKY
jgi:outer membrane immunogenic protein